MTRVPNLDLFLGRKEELRSLLAALHERESRLVWGPSDAGKSALIRKLFSELTESERRGCICWKGPAGKHLKREIRTIFEVSALEILERRGSGRDCPLLVRALEDLVDNSGRLGAGSRRKTYPAHVSSIAGGH
jgi:ABC-type polar amino acid transport system ATPase subunit